MLAELRRDTLADADMTPKQVADLSRKLNKIEFELAQIDIFGFAKFVSIGSVDRVNRQNKDQVANSMKRSMGIDIASLLDDKPVRGILDAAVEANAALIQSIKTDYVADIGKVIRDNVFSGQRSTNLITQIKEQGAVSESRARFIARDQTAKVTADLTQARSEAIGSATYVWYGSMDERERDSHKVLQGMLCKWSDPTVYSDDDGKTWKSRKSIGAYIGHPGTDYQCRCTAMPVINWG